MMIKAHRNIVLGGILSAAAAAAAPGYAAPADTADYVMTDFESGQILGTPLNGYWYNFTDRNTATSIDSIYGNSRLTSFDSSGFPFTDSLGYYDARTFPPGRSGDSASHCLRFAYALGDRKLSCGAACSYEPYVGFGMRFTTMADTVDLTGATAISFWAKAEDSAVTVDVSVGTRDTTPNSADYGQTFTVGPGWKQYTINLAPSGDFKQPTWAAHKTFNPKVATGVGFGINLGANKARPVNAVLIDDLVIQDWAYVDPNTIPDAIAAHRPAPAVGGLRAMRTSEGLRVVLPESYRNRGGTLQAVDARGAVRGSAEFAPHTGEAILRLTPSGGSGRILLRILADR